MERAIAYIRVSSDRQVDGNSLTTQEKRVLEHVSSKGYELEKIFVGKGESAKTDQRPELQEMLAYAKKRRGAIQVLIFPKVDRFARYTEDYFHLKRAFKALGIRVESADERFDDSPAGRFMESLLAATAQFDNDVRAERSKGGMREAVTQGRWVWGAPRGFRNIRNNSRATIEPDPVRGPVIREAFTMLASGRFRSHSVRSWLASRGITLSRSQFYRMIHNKAYIGIIEAFGVVERAAPPFVPLVSEAAFYRAQAALRKTRTPKTYQRDNPDFPLRGTLRCPAGHLLTAAWSAGRTRRYAYYRCKQCAAVNVRREHAEEAFLAALRATRARYKLYPLLRDELVAAWAEDRQERTKRIESLKNELAKLTQLQKAVVLKTAEGVLPDELAREQIDELRLKIAEKRSELAESEAGNEDIDRILDQGSQFLSQVEAFWSEGDVECKKHIQSFFCPSGATLLAGTQSGTVENGSRTDKGATTCALMSRVVDPMHRSPNRKPRIQKVRTGELLDFFQKLHREFCEA